MCENLYGVVRKCGNKEIYKGMLIIAFISRFICSSIVSHLFCAFSRNFRFICTFCYSNICSDLHHFYKGHKSYYFMHFQRVFIKFLEICSLTIILNNFQSQHEDLCENSKHIKTNKNGDKRVRNYYLRGMHEQIIFNTAKFIRGFYAEISQLKFKGRLHDKITIETLQEREALGYFSAISFFIHIFC